MKTHPIFVFPRLKMSAIQIQELLFRLNVYGEEWSKRNSSPLVAFVPRTKEIDIIVSNLSVPHLRVLFLGKNPILNAVFPSRVMNFVRSMDSQFTFICGDLLLAPITAFIIKCFFPSRVRSQISLHGNPRSGWGFSPLGIAKKMLLHFAIGNSESIRVVSNQIMRELCDVRGLPENKFVIAPIPTLPPVGQSNAISRGRIAFVGRLHPERNTEEWCEIIEFLFDVDPDFNADVIGGGCNLMLMKNRLSPFIDRRVYFIGELNKKELEESWDRISILLSPAKEEGFGLAIREALIRGVFVIARRNAGTQYLFEKMKGIYLYNHAHEAVELACELKYKIFNKPEIEFNLEFLSIENRKSLATLVASWDF